MSGSRGITVVEVIVALAIATILATSAVVGGHGHLAHAKASFDELAASRQAASYLESLERPEAGTVEFAVDPEVLPGGEGRLEVRRLEPGLLEVAVTVHWPPDNRVRLVTLREER